jgi:hypothetical protein
MNPVKFQEKIQDLIEYLPRTRQNIHETHYESALIPQSKPTATKCDDCGKTVIGLKQKIWVIGFATKPKWQKKCQTCKNIVEIKGPSLISHK